MNRFFGEWLEKEYHRKKHSALDMTPLDKYLSQMSRVKMVEDPVSLKVLFLKRDKRAVKHDGTISLQKKLFEVPPEFIGQKVEVRFNDSLSQVYIFQDGVQVAKAKAVNMADNAHVKRERLTLSFTAIDEKHKGGS